MDFKEFLKNNVVCLDGAMGTMLQGYGLAPGELLTRSGTAPWCYK